MAHPLTAPEPCADRETASVLVAEVPRYTAGRTARLAALAARAAVTGRVLQVLTPAHTTVTLPLEEMLLAVRGSWVRRDGRGFADGLTGAPVQWTGERFTVSGPAPAARGDAVGGVEVQVVTTHRGRDGFGRAADLVVTALASSGPRGWGVAEPVTQPWSERAVAAHCVERGPEPTSLVVVGTGAVGTLRADPHVDGVRERVHVGGPPAERVAASAMEELADLLAPSVRTVLVSARPGLVDGVRTPGPHPPAVPWGLLLGAEVVAERGTEHARTTPADVRIVDGACWCRLTQGATQLVAVLAHFGGLSV